MATHFRPKSPSQLRLSFSLKKSCVVPIAHRTHRTILFAHRKWPDGREYGRGKYGRNIWPRFTLFAGHACLLFLFLIQKLQKEAMDVQ
jgi:hypothetical protein